MTVHSSLAYPLTLESRPPSILSRLPALPSPPADPHPTATSSLNTSLRIEPIVVPGLGPGSSDKCRGLASPPFEGTGLLTSPKMPWRLVFTKMGWSCANAFATCQGITKTSAMGGGGGCTGMVRTNQASWYVLVQSYIHSAIPPCTIAYSLLRIARMLSLPSPIRFTFRATRALPVGIRLSSRIARR